MEEEIEFDFNWDELTTKQKEQNWLGTLIDSVPNSSGSGVLSPEAIKKYYGNLKHLNLD